MKSKPSIRRFLKNFQYTDSHGRSKASRRRSPAALKRGDQCRARRDGEVCPGNRPASSPTTVRRARRWKKSRRRPRPVASCRRSSISTSRRTRFRRPFRLRMSSDVRGDKVVISFRIVGLEAIKEAIAKEFREDWSRRAPK